MKNSFIILINALAVMGVAYLAYEADINAGILPVLLMLIGIINLVLNNGAQGGSTDQLKIIGGLSILSILIAGYYIWKLLPDGAMYLILSWFLLIIINAMTILYVKKAIRYYSL